MGGPSSIGTSFAFGCVDTAVRFARYDRVTGRVTTLLNGRVEAVASDDAGRRSCTNAPAARRRLSRPSTTCSIRAYGVPLPMPAPVWPAHGRCRHHRVLHDTDDPTLLPDNEDSNAVSGRVRRRFALAPRPRQRRPRRSLGSGHGPRLHEQRRRRRRGWRSRRRRADQPAGAGRRLAPARRRATVPGGRRRQRVLQDAHRHRQPGRRGATAVVRLDGDDGTARTHQRARSRPRQAHRVRRRGERASPSFCRHRRVQPATGQRTHHELGRDRVRRARRARQRRALHVVVPGRRAPPDASRCSTCCRTPATPPRP